MTTKSIRSREVILYCLTQILEKGAQSHMILSDALGAMNGAKREDKAFVTRVTEGVLEHLLTIDAGLNAISSVRVADMKPVIREILRMSVYQIIYMDRVPARAAVNEAVDLAGSHGFGGLGGFVNAVLRTVSRRPDAFVFSDPSLKYSMPSWLIEKWQEDYGPEKTDLMLQSFFDVRPVSMHVMTSRASVEEVEKSLLKQGVKAEISPLSDRILLLSGCDGVESLKAFSDGLMFAQDEGSSLVGEAAGIQKNDLVTDVCASPGGKSMDAADRLCGRGMVISRDRTGKKVSLIEENKRRLGLENITAQVWDATYYDENLEGRADVVIADCPCSGLGEIARKPEIKYRVSREECAELAILQRKILSVVCRYVKPGGKLIYSTCTINREENSDQRKWFLSEHDEFHAVPLKLTAAKLSKKETLTEGYLQLLPGTDPGDGFFISVFERGR